MIKDLKYHTISAGPNLSIVLTEEGKLVYWGDDEFFETEEKMIK